MQPRNSLEAELLDRIGVHLFRSDQAGLAADAQAASRIRHEAGERAKTDVVEALELGKDLCGNSLCRFPRIQTFPPSWISRRGAMRTRILDTPAGCCSDSSGPSPAATGCSSAVRELDRRLNVEGPWRPADALTMVRLTGKHAIDLEDDYDVARVLLCSLTVSGAARPTARTEPVDRGAARS